MARMQRHGYAMDYEYEYDYDYDYEYEEEAPNIPSIQPRLKAARSTRSGVCSEKQVPIREKTR